MTENEKNRKKYEEKKEKGYFDLNMEYYDKTDVKNGSWVMVIRTIPVVKSAQPQVYGIYWGVPKQDKFDRQVCEIFTTTSVTLLNHEYTVISEERLQLYREEGWVLHEKNNKKFQEPLNLELIEKGRSLCEEERETIWALQLDGLSETQACEEYFLSKHTDYNNYTICYLLSAEIAADLEKIFGKR